VSRVRVLEPVLAQHMGMGGDRQLPDTPSFWPLVAVPTDRASGQPGRAEESPTAVVVRRLAITVALANQAASPLTIPTNANAP
jgi:hypothetical protein